MQPIHREYLKISFEKLRITPILSIFNIETKEAIRIANTLHTNKYALQYKHRKLLKNVVYRIFEPPFFDRKRERILK